MNLDYVKYLKDYLESFYDCIEKDDAIDFLLKSTYCTKEESIKAYELSNSNI